MKTYINILCLCLSYTAGLSATVYSAATLKKDGATVYLLSDVEDNNPCSREQREALLARAADPKTILLVRDPDDVQGHLNTISCEQTKRRLQNRQALIEEIAEAQVGVVSGLATLARRRSIELVNISCESVVLCPDNPCATVIGLLEDLLVHVHPSIAYLPPAAKERFIADKDFLIKNLNDANRNIPMVNNALQRFFIRLQELSALTFACNIASGAHLVICAKAEDTAFIAERLVELGWQGDASTCIDLYARLVSVIEGGLAQQTTWFEEKQEATIKLQQSLQKVKQAASKQKLKAAFEKQWQRTWLNPKELEALALRSERPVDLKVFFGLEDQAQVSVDPQPSCSSDVQAPALNPSSTHASGIEDARARLNKILAMAQDIALEDMPIDAKVSLVRSVRAQLMPVLHLDAQQTDANAEVLAMQIHASELMGYFYLHAGLREQALISFYNALAIGQQTDITYLIPGTPYFNATISLAQLIKDGALCKLYTSLLSQDGFTAPEIESAIAYFSNF